MFKNYFKIAWRNLWHNRQHSLVNLAGLTLGLTAFLMILLYVMYERSYDNFQSNKANLFRVNYKQYHDGKLELDNAAAVPAVGPAMKENFPEVIDYARLTAYNTSVVTYKNQSFREERIRVVDPSFLKLFSFPLLKGNIANALDAPNTVVITAATAKKYFGNNDPLGKSLTIDGKHNVEITGVCRDVPANSHIRFDFLLSMQQFYGSKQENAKWYWYDFYTYILLKPGTSANVFQTKFNAWLTQQMKQEWKDQSMRQEFILQPVTDIHLYSHRMQELEPQEQGDGRMMDFLIIIGILILTIAWANYINLTTSHAVSRGKEIGVRKVIGASRQQLSGLFLTESTLLNVLAVICAIILVKVLMPLFEQMIGHTLYLQNAAFIGFIFISVIVGSIISGFYPALLFTRFQPSAILRGSVFTVIKGFRLRQVLVVFQFTISIVLIIGIIIVYRQLTYLRTKDLGVNLDQTLIVSSPEILEADSLYPGSVEAFKTELKKLPSIKQVTASSSVPGQEIGWMNTITQKSDNIVQEGKNSKAIYIIGVDSNYITSYGIKIIAGSNFSESPYTDKENTVLLNQTAAQLLGYASPQQSIGQQVNFRGKYRTVIGITDNYNHVSPKEAVIPIVFTYQPASKGYFSIKLNPVQAGEIVEQMKKIYKSFFPGNPFSWYFLDDAFNQQFQADLQFGKLFAIFTCLAIIVACLGLFALSAFAAEQRTKEIGIRKVLGASVSGIAGLLSKDFMKLVLIASVIAFPIGWWTMHNWLQNYAYRIEIRWEVFIIAGLIALLIALITISFQAIKAAIANPVKSLRTE
jgi:putative ABC transport system permease protein